jgi:DNA repair photolyase
MAQQAGEYAPLACNPYRGCGHKCAYCYVPLVTRQERARNSTPAPYCARISWPACAGRRAGIRRHGITEQVMLSFTSDPYHPGDTTPTRETLEILIEHGLASAP